jgi:lysophospholipase L1-like esterase
VSETQTESPPTALTPALAFGTKTGRTLLFIALLAAAAQLLPGAAGERVRWVPEQLSELVPRFLRFEHDALPWESNRADDALAAEVPVDDGALMALAGAPEPAASTPGSSAPAHTPDANAAAPAPASRAPIALRGVFEESTPLPPAPEARDLGNGLSLMPIEDPHHVLDGFYAALARTAAGQGQTRVVHYGDSLITGDYITQTLRRLFQKKFGDAGHGFVLGGLTSPWYRRNNLDIKTSEDWRLNRITRPQLGDGFYGLGAVAVRADTPGQWVEYAPRDQNGKPDTPEAAALPPLNQKIGRVEVFAWGGPRAASFEVRVDGDVVGTVNARQPTEQAVFGQFDLDDAPHKVRVTTTGGGEARLFGVALERRVPGVVYDSIGVDGTRVKLLRFLNPEHWYAQLRHRDPALVVLHYGTNEGEAADLGTKNYREDLLPVVRGLRAGLPDVPCLLVGPMDRADTNDKGELVSRPVVQRISEVQRRVAYMAGCAYFDTFKAMGGEGSMAKWYKNHLGGGDMTHPTRQGADRIGAMIFAALMDGYRKSRP